MSYEYYARKATMNDVSDLAKYSCMLAKQIEQRDLCPISLQESYSRIISDESLGLIFVCVERGSSEFAGYCYASKEWSNWRNGIVLWVELFIVEDHRGNGSALKPLYERLLSAAQNESDVCAIRGYTHNPECVSNIDLPVVERKVFLLEKDLEKHEQ